MSNTVSTTTCDLYEAGSQGGKPKQDTEEETLSTDNRQHLQRLREWCNLHWEATIVKSMQSLNPVIFHDCCTSFSRRTFAKKSGHPGLQSASVLRIPTLRAVESPEGLCKWLLEKARSQESQGIKPLFPKINRTHLSRDTPEEDVTHQRFAYLNKRAERLQEELETANRLLQVMAAENKRLLDSSRNWFTKYQEQQDQSADLLAWPSEDVATS